MSDTLSVALLTIVSPLVFVGYLLLIRWLDRYEREPLGALISVMVVGGLGAVGLTLAIRWPIYVLLDVSGEVTFVEYGVIAPLVEEFCKAAMFAVIIATGFLGDSKFNIVRQIDNETDGLIYGAAIGLGFAAIENAMYVLGYASFVSSHAWMVSEPVGDSIWGMVWTRATIVLHPLTTALVGWGIGYARHRRGRWRGLIYAGHGWAVAVILHSQWNQLADRNTLLQDTDGLLWLYAAGLAVFFGLMQISLIREHRVLRGYLLREARRGTLPAEHAKTIPFWWRRVRRDWLDDAIPHQAYVRTATKLALRLYQRDLADDARDHATSRDIDQFRHHLQAWNRGQTVEDERAV